MRVLRLSAAFALLALAPRPSTAYLTRSANGNLIRWGPGSPASAWDDEAKTLSWAFNRINFPQPSWPSAEAAGAAFENAFQTYQDVVGSSFKHRRLPDVSDPPVRGDGLVGISLAPDENSGPFGSIAGAFAVTYTSWNASTGALRDADIVFNGDPDTLIWSTALPAPAGTNDLEVTLLHEGLHAVGSGHPVYLFAAVWPSGRFPEHTTMDRCLSPDDRVLLRTLYPEAPLLGRIDGQVALSSGGGADRAVVVAVDADGVPQATQVSSAAGAYSLNVPAGTYSVTAHHFSNVNYAAGDISFSGADPFIHATTASGVAVSAGGVGDGGTITATAGAPTLRFTALALNPDPLGTQTLFLDRGTNGTARFRLSGSTFTTPEIQSVSFGPGLTTGAATKSGEVVSVPFGVSASAAPGPRTVELVLTTGERGLLPSGVFVRAPGSLALSAGPANPAGGPVPLSSADVPLLQVILEAGAAEDVRVRRLAFSLNGTAPTLPDVRLWRDVDASGTVTPGDLRVFSGAAYASAPPGETKPGATGESVVFDNLSLPVLAGAANAVTLLLSADLPASGAGSVVSASLASADATAHGLFYGDVLAPSGGTLSGGVVTLGGVTLSGAAQIRTSGGEPIAVGGFTPETQVTIQALVSAPSGTVGIEAEVKPLGAAFTGTGTVATADTFPSGSTLSAIVGGLADQTSYHWRIRALSSEFAPGPWSSFGGNAETAADFSVDLSTTSPPSGLEQHDRAGAPVLLGGAAPGSILLSALNGSNSAGAPVRLELEAAAVLSGAPTHAADPGPAGALLFEGPPGAYRWQARSVGPFGSASAWVTFDPAPEHFRIVPVEVVEASAGCVGQAAGDVPLALLLALAVLPFAVRRRKAAAALLALLAAGTARADEPWGSASAYAGTLLFDADFETEGADLARRELSGTGTAMAGVDLLLHPGPDWGLGATLELGMSSDVRILGAGPLLTWRFAASKETEHRARLGFLYQTLEVDKSGFGDFDAAFAPRLGYEFRHALSERWALTVGLELRYAVWEYADEVLSGDDELGGAGALISIGIAFRP